MGQTSEEVETERKLKLTPAFMADMWWWGMVREPGKMEDRGTVGIPFLFVKQEPSKQWFSDA